MLNDNEVNCLIGDGRALWLRVEEVGLAYHRRYTAKANLAKYLTNATLFAGICTAVSTLESANEFIPTAFPAVITAITATISQVLNPEKNQRESWKIWKQIESLKFTLASRCRGLYLAGSFTDEQIVFQSFATHFESLLDADIPITDSIKESAIKNLSSADLSPIKSNVDPFPEPIEELAADQDEDASEGVQAVARRVA